MKITFKDYILNYDEVSIEDFHLYLNKLSKGERVILTSPKDFFDLDIEEVMKLIPSLKHWVSRPMPVGKDYEDLGFYIQPESLDDLGKDFKIFITKLDEDSFRVTYSYKAYLNQYPSCNGVYYKEKTLTKEQVFSDYEYILNEGGKQL